jgi:hypothetical protein
LLVVREFVMNAASVSKLREKDSEKEPWDVVVNLLLV